MSHARLLPKTVAPILLVLLFAPAVAGQELQEFSYVQDFETADRVTFWASNGEHEIHFKGLTEEQAFSGNKSFKLDVTLESGSYHYWQIRVRVPAAGQLRFSGRILVAERSAVSAGLGVNVAFPPTTHSTCGPFDQFSGPTEGWKLIEGDVVATGQHAARSLIDSYVYRATAQDIGVYVDRGGIFLHGKGHIVLYVDDIRIEGKVPDEEAYKQEIKRRWQGFSERWQQQLSDWREQMTAAEQAFAKLPEVTDDRLVSVKTTVQLLLTSAQERLAEMEGQSFTSPSAAMGLTKDAAAVSQFPPVFRMMAEAVEVGRPFITYVPRAITNVRVLPDSFPSVPGTAGGKLRIAGCRDEYESATFAVYALEDLDELMVEPGDLAGAGGVIPASAVDIHVVKCWYQAGRHILDLTHKQLVPELLLKDDALVRVDTEEEANYLRSTAEDGTTRYLLASGKDSANLADVRPIDAATLQPVAIPANSLKQFWVTVHIPENAAAGRYTGSLRLSAPGITPAELPLAVTVHPFDLTEPDMIFSIYYRGILSADNQPTITAEWRSEQQYLAEMRDMRAHGVLYPNLYHHYRGYPPQLLTRALALRQQAGLASKMLFLGCSTEPSPEEGLNALRNDVKKCMDLAAEFGYKEVYFYGTDEVTGERLVAQRSTWEAIHQAGGKTYVACFKEAFEAIGDLLDVAVLGKAPQPEEAEKWHSVGAKILCYDNPQSGVEEPETYRRNFGLLLWKAGYDGAMNYAYQHGFGHVWNDFDSSSYRDHNFTYPTVNGIVGTIQWEGFREAVDDVRYITTLEKAIEQAGDTEQAQRAQRWLDRLDLGGDLDQIRKRAVGWIKRLLTHLGPQ